MSGEIPLRARKRGFADSGDVIAIAFATALTPRSVRLATSILAEPGDGAILPLTTPRLTSPSTVRSRGWRAQPKYGAPSYPKRTNQRVVLH